VSDQNKIQKSHGGELNKASDLPASIDAFMQAHGSFAAAAGLTAAGLAANPEQTNAWLDGTTRVYANEAAKLADGETFGRMVFAFEQAQQAEPVRTPLTDWQKVNELSAIKAKIDAIASGGK
jgi:hypothetical protein